MKTSNIGDKIEIEKLRKEDDFKEIKISNMGETMKGMEAGEMSLKDKLSKMGDENAQYSRRINEMNSMLTSLLIQLTKIKDEHMSMKQKFNVLNKENELLKDKNGIDLGQMTPRPNWKGLTSQYKINYIETGKVEFEKNLTFVDFQSTCLVVEKLMMKLSHKPNKKSFKSKTKSKNSRPKKGTKSRAFPTDSQDMTSKTSAFPYHDLNTSRISSQGDYNSPAPSVNKYMRRSISKHQRDNDLGQMIDRAKLDALKTKVRLDQMSEENNLAPITFSRTISPTKLMDDIKELRSLNILEIQGDEADEEPGEFQTLTRNKGLDMTDEANDTFQFDESLIQD